MEKIQDTLRSRNSVHGNFTDNSNISQTFKTIIRNADCPLNNVQKESLDMIVHKIARILAGDPNHADHWHDIAGYATLAEERIEQNLETRDFETVAEKKVGLDEAIIKHKEMETREIQMKKEAIGMALGEASALFMSQPIKGTEIVMPSEELRAISQRLFQNLFN